MVTYSCFLKNHLVVSVMFRALNLKVMVWKEPVGQSGSLTTHHFLPLSHHLVCTVTFDLVGC